MVALRPGLVRKQQYTFWHYVNLIFQVASMATMIFFWGPNPFYYFLTCVLLSGSLHPMAGHFIAEHFIFVKGYETYSYYGPMNMYFI
jgi:sphingolipid delta-4 desaturase